MTASPDRETLGVNTIKTPRKILHLGRSRHVEVQEQIATAKLDSRRNASDPGDAHGDKQKRAIAIRQRRGNVTQSAIIGAAIDMRKQCFSTAGMNLF